MPASVRSAVLATLLALSASLLLFWAEPAHAQDVCPAWPDPDEGPQDPGPNPYDNGEQPPPPDQWPEDLLSDPDPVPMVSAPLLGMLGLALIGIGLAARKLVRQPAALLLVLAVLFAQARPVAADPPDLPRWERELQALERTGLADAYDAAMREAIALPGVQRAMRADPVRQEWVRRWSSGTPEDLVVAASMTKRIRPLKVDDATQRRLDEILLNREVEWAARTYARILADPEFAAAALSGTLSASARERLFANGQPYSQRQSNEVAGAVAAISYKFVYDTTKYVIKGAARFGSWGAVAGLTFAVGVFAWRAYKIVSDCPQNKTG